MSLRERLLYVAENFSAKESDALLSHEVDNMLTRRIPLSLYKLSEVNREEFKITGMQTALFPYINIVDKKSVTGLAISYALSEDGQRLYLVLKREEEDAPTIADIRFFTPEHVRIKKDHLLMIGTSSDAKSFEDNVALYVPYHIEDFASDRQLYEDLTLFIEIHRQFLKAHGMSKELLSDKDVITHMKEYIKSQGFTYEDEDLTNIYLSLKTKPFIILSGMSGTGKTKLAQLLAESLGATFENGRLALIPVRPDWHDGSDLLGYIDLRGDFRKGAFLGIVQQAIQHPTYTYVAILDEMNLARVEHYLSDVLSVIESRKWQERKIKTAPLLPGHRMFRDVYIPPNLLIVGTVNMDETTHSFSQKVLDRTNTVELNTIHLDSFESLTQDSLVTAGIETTQIQSLYIHLKDAYVEHGELINEVTNELMSLNELLRPIDCQVGYRMRDEICFYMIYAIKSGVFTFDQAFDFQLLQKIAPRISGGDVYTFDVLKELYYYCTNTFVDQNIETAVIEAERMRFPRSAKKVMEMIRRYEAFGYTSFWTNTVR
ncbi:DUF3578 domain-containing protein [Priestia flexa]|uniref:McrB family protein n=1 Tax=Priestia flexa TaxID=86664 RepID=UPI0020A2175B|nr:DUF3578 domain-containing protein [Priestia flexa]MCP1189254.1 DUF3578 domain-containing protein [Priestia flexa]